jgi:hypothetical protein
VLASSRREDAVVYRGDGRTGADLWERSFECFAEEVERYEYPGSLGYSHDLIDPEGTNAEQIDDIYRVLYEHLELPPE